MAGSAPATTVQAATDVDSRIIVGVRTLNSGNDQSQMVPMLDVIAERLGRLPQAHLVDGGFVTKAAITEATVLDVTVYAPSTQRGRTTETSGAPLPGDSPAVAA